MPINDAVPGEWVAGNHLGAWEGGGTRALSIALSAKRGATAARRHRVNRVLDKTKFGPAIAVALPIPRLQATHPPSGPPTHPPSAGGWQA